MVSVCAAQTQMLEGPFILFTERMLQWVTFKRVESGVGERSHLHRTAAKNQIISESIVYFSCIIIFKQVFLHPLQRCQEWQPNTPSLGWVGAACTCLSPSGFTCVEHQLKILKHGFFSGIELYLFLIIKCECECESACVCVCVRVSECEHAHAHVRLCFKHFHNEFPSAFVAVVIKASVFAIYLAKCLS